MVAEAFARRNWVHTFSRNPKYRSAAICLVPTEEHSLDEASVDRSAPRRILFEEYERARSSLLTLGIGFSISHTERQWKGGRPKKPPYLCCRYNAGDLGNVNITAFCHPLLGDWELMERDVQRYQQRIHSAIREEIIHAIQIITAKKKYDQGEWRKRRFQTAEIFLRAFARSDHRRTRDENRRKASGFDCCSTLLRGLDHQLHGTAQRDGQKVARPRWIPRNRTHPAVNSDQAWRADQRRGQGQRVGQASPFLRWKLWDHRESLEVHGRDIASLGSQTGHSQPNLGRSVVRNRRSHSNNR
jgi:hypothetical protein